MLGLEKNNRIAYNHFLGVKERLIQNIDYALNNGAQINSRKFILNSNEKRFLNFIKQDKNLKKIVLANVCDFEEIMNCFKSVNAKTGSTKSSFNRILYNIFVRNLYEDVDCFDKSNFISNLSLDTCPYCNRNYIYVLTKEGKVKPEIDHFLPKSKYPYFGISFFNLIPSCQTCNGIAAKGELDPLIENIVSPYEIKSTDFEFEYEINSVDVLSPLNGKSGINISFKKNDIISENIKVFKLAELYKKHEDHAIELIVKSKVKYGENARKYLNSYNGMKFSDSEINRMIVGNFTNIEDLHKRPLSKMYRDIAIKEGLI